MGEYKRSYVRGLNTKYKCKMQKNDSKGYNNMRYQTLNTMN